MMIRYCCVFAVLGIAQLAYGQDAFLLDYLAAREAAIRMKSEGQVDAYIESKTDTASRVSQREIAQGGGTGDVLVGTQSSCSVTANGGAKINVAGDLILACRNR